MDLHADKGGHAVATAITFTAITAVLVIFRWVSRLGVVHSAGTDDVLIIGSLVWQILTVSENSIHFFPWARYTTRK